MSGTRIPESVLARIWHDGWHSQEMRTTSGLRLAVVYRGVWTHSNGPDFRDSMLEIDGRLHTGPVELHVRSSDWFRHGHHENPEYDDVILHVVLEDDAPGPCHGPGRRPVPTVEIGHYLNGPIDRYVDVALPVDLGSLGQRACLPTFAGGRQDSIRDVLRREGWRRMQEKQLRFTQALVQHPPAEVLYRGMLDSLGLMANRAPMSGVADRLPLHLIERITARTGPDGCLATLLGVGGFLPLSPAHAGLVSDGSLPDLDALWTEISGEYLLGSISPGTWNLRRVRPLNHPARRLASMAWLLSDTVGEGLLPAVVSGMSSAGAGWDAWLAKAVPAIGESRRRQILVNTLAPFVAALADATGDEEMSLQASEIWETLPGKVDDEIARSTLRQITGGQRFRITTAIEVQGLHQIGRHGCAHLRCYECPIAELAVLYE